MRAPAFDIRASTSGDTGRGDDGAVGTGAEGDLLTSLVPDAILWRMSDTDKRTETTAIEAIAGKAEWEGGIIGLLEHGAYQDAVTGDAGFDALWQQVQVAWGEFSPLLDALQERFDEVHEPM